MSTVRNIVRFLALLIVLVLASAGPGAAQSLRVSGLSSASPEPLLDGVTGFAVFGDVDVMSWLIVFAGITRSTADSERQGTACGVFRPYPVDCTTDRLAEHVSLLSYRVGGQLSVDAFESVRVGAGLGGSLNEIRSRSRGVTSNLPGTLYSPPSGNMGVFLEARAAWSLLYNLALVASATHSWISFQGCRDNDLDYAPFCGGERLVEVHLGLAYRLF